MINLLNLDRASLAALLRDLGEKPFRATQLVRWIHRGLVDDVAAMTDISKALREKLAAAVEIRGPRVIGDTAARDGTRKWLLDVGSANAVETVYIPDGDYVVDAGDSDLDGDSAPPPPDAVLRASDEAIPARAESALPGARYRGTLCISSQAGCALDCAFCATGKQGFNRNLSVAEIVGQLWFANRALAASGVNAAAIAAGRAPITNVVMMGMGEPLANFDAVVAALSLFVDDNAYGLSRRRVTVSTAGLVPAIDRLRDACPVALAVSLHAGNDPLRDRLVPINRKYPLASLLAACRRYLERAPRDFVTFEYVMLDGVNDTPEHAREVAARVRDVPCKFNLIPFNPFPGTEFRTSSTARILAFQRVLIDAGYVTTVRRTRGDDIDAACGQLAGRVQDRTKRRAAIAISTAAT